MTFSLDAASLSAWQACRKRYALQREWYPRKWRPRSLFSSCLRAAIYDISNGADPKEAAREARVRFMQVASNPGLDLPPGADTYQLSKDYCVILDVIPRSVAKLVLLTMRPVRDTLLESGIYWHTLAWADDSGALHRWVFVDRADADRMHSEAISWYVAGDVMLSRMPMTLHFIDVGKMRQGRMRSPWTEAYFLPAMRNTDYHFRAKSGAPLRGQWQKKYLVDDVHADVDAWAERCWSEGAAMSWMRHVEVSVPSEEACVAAAKMICDEAREMRGAREWTEYAMTRGACDGPFSPCQYQSCCYAPQPVSIDSLGLYQPRNPVYASEPKENPVCTLS